MKLSMNQKWFTATHHDSKVPTAQGRQNPHGSQWGNIYLESEEHDVNFIFWNSVFHSVDI